LVSDYNYLCLEVRSTPEEPHPSSQEAEFFKIQFVLISLTILEHLLGKVLRRAPEKLFRKMD
jgi:hypothetical protein